MSSALVVYTQSISPCFATEVEQDSVFQLGSCNLCIVPPVGLDASATHSHPSVFCVRLSVTAVALQLSCNVARYFSLNNEPRTAASSFCLPFALVDLAQVHRIVQRCPTNITQDAPSGGQTHTARQECQAQDSAGLQQAEHSDNVFNRDQPMQ